MPLRSMNPATGELLKEHLVWTPDQAAETLEKIHQAWLSWRYLPVARKSGPMRALAGKLRAGKEEFARAITLEMGKPIVQSRAEIEKCAVCCDFYAEHAEGYLTPEAVPSDAGKSYVRFDPLGPILAVMPWNFPFWQAFRFAAPAVMAGNAVALKTASNTTWCGLLIEGLFGQAGFPEDLVRTFLVGADQVSALIDHPAIAGVTLTGSSIAGRAVAAAAGRALKKSVLELGGSDPFIVLEDADLDRAIAQAVASRTICTGQSCIAAKRFIVDRRVYEPFVEGFTRQMAALVVGDPLLDATEIGPMARVDLRDELHGQVVRSVSMGGRVTTGGKFVDGPGAFYLPTVLVDVGPGSPAHDEELFGPVAAVFRVEGAEGAVQLANRTSFGLGASIWTSDTSRAEEIAARIESGAVFINGMVKSDPRLPFGGIKTSGYGRELSSYGIREFVNIKTVWVK